MKHDKDLGFSRTHTRGACYSKKKKLKTHFNKSVKLECQTSN